jgi:hypothetical protein
MKFYAMVANPDSLKVNFMLTEQAMKAHRGSRRIALLLFNLNTSWGWVVNVMLYDSKEIKYKFFVTYCLTYRSHTHWDDTRI